MGGLGEIIEAIFSYFFSATGFVAQSGAKKAMAKYGGGFSKPKKSQAIFGKGQTLGRGGPPVEYGKPTKVSQRKPAPNLRRSGSSASRTAVKQPGGSKGGPTQRGAGARPTSAARPANVLRRGR